MGSYSALIVHEHLADFVQQYSFKSSYWRSGAIEDKEGGHGRHLEHLLHFLTFITIDIDEEIFLIKFFSDLRHICLDRLAGSAPSGRNLTEGFLRSSAHDSLTEFIYVLGIDKRHDDVDDLFRIYFFN